MDELEGAEYLGDGLFIKHTKWEITLFAHNGIRATDKVHLGPDELKRFQTYLAKNRLTAD